MQVYTFSTKNKVVALLAGLVVLGAGAALLLLGLALLAGVAVVGSVLGVGIVAYRALRGRPAVPLQRSPSASGLDPSLEVFADPRAIGDAPPPSAPNDEDRPRLGSE